MNPSQVTPRGAAPNADGSTVYRTRRDPDASATVSVVRAVAEVEDVTPGDLPVLGDVIDPEALDGVFEGDQRVGRSTARLSFDYCGYTVTVTDDVVALDVR
ncbi:HalOD1 output domain-containing protein [Halobellus limi]|mgnify:CR=1 FL=1|uniref:Halobacterial output domain-containing protein n=1 Tax=Halobellus limi TaxID=699433 RepID=A0A1H6BDP4_9EURY|nr:HalOD1 output domain-containing protein [Halobellus limi]SEG58790.1 hypothetical protein SAMN04488133_2780 [Halobellus limi]